jgi:hypothetical protein
MRCRNPKNPAYKHYGGRGIVVCERWQGKEGFSNFLADMGKRPSNLYSLDRFPNNDGNYEPGNCRWAVKLEQMMNRRKHAMLCDFSHEEIKAEFLRRKFDPATI